MRRTGLNLVLLLAYAAGVPPALLARAYYGRPRRTAAGAAGRVA